MTGVAVRQDGTWRLVQLHVSAAVSDEDLLASPSSVLQPVLALENEVEQQPGQGDGGDGGGEAGFLAEAWVGHVHTEEAGDERGDSDDRGPAGDLLGDDVQPVAVRSRWLR